MKKNRANKSNIVKKTLVAGMAIVVSFSALTGCSTTAKMGTNAGVAYQSESKVVNALNNTIVKNVNDKKILSSSAELVDNGYNVTIITDETVEQFTLDQNLNVTGSEDITGDSATAPATSAVGDNSTSITPITPNVNTDAITAILATLGEGTIDEADKAIIEGIISNITPANIPTVISNLQVAYAQALTFADITAEEVLDLDFSREYYMGINAVVVDMKTANAKYTYIFNADTFALFESKIKLKTTTEIEETSYIAENTAVEIALKTVNATEETVSKFKVKFGKRKGIKNYKISFEFEGYDYQVDINALTGQVVKFEKSITEEKVLTETVETAITSDDALGIATAFIGIDVADKTLQFEKKIKLDYEDGGFVYEIKIKYDDVDYEFEIDAATGEIFDVDIDDDKDDEVKIGKDKGNKVDKDDDDDDDEDKKLLPTTTFISEEQAIELVLAKVNEEDALVVGVEVEHEGEKQAKKFFFEIEVQTSTGIVEYKVDAENGTVKKEKLENEDSSWYDNLKKFGEELDEKLGKKPITSKEAVKQALKAASATAKEAKINKVEFIQNKKGSVYKIRFSVNSIKYSFDINAETGEIVESGTMFD